MNPALRDCLLNSATLSGGPGSNGAENNAKESDFSYFPLGQAVVSA